MIETDTRIKQKAEWTQEHTLTRKQFQQLIREKIERARVGSEALKKREELVGQLR